MYLLYNSYGFKGIYILTIIISVLIIITFFNILIQNKHGIVYSFIISFVVSYLSSGLFCARNQIFSFLIFELEIFSLNKLMEQGKKKYFCLLLILAFLLVQFHDTVYPLFFVMMLPYLAEIILSKFFSLEKSDKLEYSNLLNGKYLIILIVLSLGIGLFTPIFGTAYTNLVNCMNGISTEFIGELKPVYIFDFFIITFLCFSTIGILCFTKTKVKVKDLLFVFGFLIFSLMAMRNVYFLLLIGVVFWANIVRDFFNTYTEKDSLVKLDNSKVLIVSFVCLISVMSVKNFLANITKNYVDDLKYPKVATEWILENVDYKNMKIWTHFNWGSYLELNGIKVFVDSRSGMYTEQENEGCTVLSDWNDVTSGIENYKNILKKYDITHVLVENYELINQYICDDEDYEMIYQDNLFTLYERTN